MRPESEAALAEAIRSAAEPLRPVGGGTRMLPGEGRGTPLDTSGLSGITLYEPAALTLVARAGTPMTEITAALAAENQMLAFEPPLKAETPPFRSDLPEDDKDMIDLRPDDRSTIGGVIAANASGPRRVQAGAARDALIGVRVVDGSGTVFANGGRVMKNVTGYDLVKLMAGSRGTLGVLTEVALKTAPRPAAALTLRLAGLGARNAIPALTAALGGPWDVAGAGWIKGEGAIVRLEGLPRSVVLRADALSARLAVFGAVERDETMTSWARLAGLGAGWGAGGLGMVEGAIWRVVCRPSEAAAIIDRNDAEVLAIDWGGALLVLGAPSRTTPDLPPGARATCIGGGGAARVPAADPVVARLEASLKARFDPRNILPALN